VRTHGEWEQWLAFFLEGVIETANQAVQTAHEILELFEEDTKRVQTLGRASSSAAVVHQFLQKHALTTSGKAASELALSEPTVNSALRHLETIGIVKEITGKQRRRVYAYNAYLAILRRGTER